VGVKVLPKPDTENPEPDQTNMYKADGTLIAHRLFFGTGAAIVIPPHSRR